MSRLPRLTPDDLDPAQRAVYEGVVGGRRAQGSLFRLIEADGSLTGPFNPMVVAPGVGSALSLLGEAIRYETDFTMRMREIAILIGAAHARSDYEWYAHERVGRWAGLSDTELEALKTGAPLDLDDPAEAAVLEFSRQAVASGSVDDKTYARAVEHLGHRGVVELTILLGYYLGLALLMSVNQIGVPDGETPPFAQP
jgi:4-carboxymuconolactone decarboxylase